MLLFCSCSQAQIIQVPTVVPYGIQPNTPTKIALDHIATVDYDNLEMTDSKYKLNLKLFDGWAIKLFEDTEHKYRYTKFINGQVVWQIGYFDNGDIGHDFHILGDENYGSQRMWRKGGIGYIDTYFLQGGHQHGTQKRWHSNGQLEWISEYQSGLLLSEVKYDVDGNEVKSH